jgi:trans-aconitate methyltransferase
MTAGDEWDRHWSEFADSIRRNPAQEFRRRLILRLLGDPGKLERVLDIGSGSGDFAAALRSAAPSAAFLGLELSVAGVEEAKRRVPDAEFVVRDLMESGEPAPEHRGWATHAVCSEVLEHVDEPVTLLRNAVPYLAPGCRVVVTVPGGPMTAFDRHIGHRRHYAPPELAALLAEAGFEDVRASGAGFPSFNLYRLFLLVLGERVVEHAGAAKPSRPARAATAFFEALLCRNLHLSSRGWQTVATARLPYAGRP